MITKEQALELNGNSEIYLKGYYNADGSPCRWRINGKIKTWKTRPNEFKLPLKHGLYDYNYLTDENNHKFSIEMPECIPKKDVKDVNSKFSWWN